MKKLLRFFQDSTIQNKLMMMVMLVTFVTLLMTCLTFITYDVITVRQSTVKELQLLGSVIGKRVAPALEYSKPIKALDTLTDLQSKASVRLACLYAADSKKLTEFHQGQEILSCPDKPEQGYHFQGKYLTLSQDIFSLSGNYVGALVIIADMREISQHLVQFGISIIILILIAMLIAYFMTRAVQKAISFPILSLTDTAKAVRSSRDYDIRAEKFYNDELGVLADSFNEMLSDIQHRDTTLQKVNQDLEHANKLKELWISNIGHEIRTPIHGILQISHFGVLECEKEKPDIPSFANFFARLYKSGVRLGKLIEGLLDFQKMKAGKCRLTFAEADIDQLIHEVVDELYPQITTKSLQIHHHPPACPTVSTFDADNIYHVISNIVGNATKFSPQNGRIEILISNSPVDDARPDGVAIAVKDYGVGIPEGEEEEIFDTFTQSSKTYDGSGGTGLGLSIAREIVLLHHGRIFARNNVEGAGATFTFILPRVQAKADE